MLRTFLPLIMGLTNDLEYWYIVFYKGWLWNQFTFKHGKAKTPAQSQFHGSLFVVPLNVSTQTLIHCTEPQCTLMLCTEKGSKAAKGNYCSPSVCSVLGEPLWALWAQLITYSGRVLLPPKYTHFTSNRKDKRWKRFSLLGGDWRGVLLKPLLTNIPSNFRSGGEYCEF